MRAWDKAYTDMAWKRKRIEVWDKSNDRGGHTGSSVFDKGDLCVLIPWRGVVLYLLAFVTGYCDKVRQPARESSRYVEFFRSWYEWVCTDDVHIWMGDHAPGIFFFDPWLTPPYFKMWSAEALKFFTRSAGLFNSYVHESSHIYSKCRLFQRVNQK